MIVVLAGASGLIGTALKEALRADGHELRLLVRRAPAAPDEHSWDPDRAQLDVTLLAGAEVVVNLCGVNVGDQRWTEKFKRAILTSRVHPTRTLADAIAILGSDAPGTFLSASAVGYYGDTGDQIVDESAPVGTGYFADVCRQWEEAAAAADTSHSRVVRMRSGLVLSGRGGLLARLVPLVKYGLGGKLGSGKQYQPWIAVADEVGAMRFLMAADVHGPVNLTGPDPVPQQDFVKELARQMHRPAVFPAPAFGLRLVLGQFADEGVLVGQRAIPAALTAAGYHFVHPTLAGALHAALD